MKLLDVGRSTALLVATLLQIAHPLNNSVGFKPGIIFPQFILVKQAYNLTISGCRFNPSDLATLQVSGVVPNQLYTASFQNSVEAVLSNIIVDFSGPVFFKNRECSTVWNIFVYEKPILSGLSPNKSHLTGGTSVQITGSGFFPSSFISIAFSYENISVKVPGIYDTKSEFITFTTPQFEVPPSINRESLQVNEFAFFSPSVSFTVDGVYYFSVTQPFTIKVTPIFKIGYIFYGPITDFGWTYIQNLARLSIETSYSGSVQSSYVENVPEDWSSVMNATIQYCLNNYDLIFGGSNGFLSPMANASYLDECNYYTINGTADKNITKRTYMIQATLGMFHTPSLVTVFGRVYQMRYLSGLVAGLQLKKISSTNVGYIAAFDYPEVRQGINAFVIGCRKVNPQCRVIVAWVGTWGDPYIQEQAAQYLWFHEGCRILTQHSDTTSPQIVFANGGPSVQSLQKFQVANGITDREMANYTSGKPKKGYGIGYNSDMRQLVGDSVLTSAMLVWDPIMNYFIENLMENKWPELDTYWPGVDVGAVQLADFSPLVDSHSRWIVNSELGKLTSGKDFVFCGKLLMEDGMPVPAQQPNLTVVTGKNMYNFFNMHTHTLCERQQIDAGECCLNDFPGMLDMWYQLKGCYAVKECLDRAKCTFGTVVHTTDEAGHIQGWYTPPPEFPPPPPQLRMLCESFSEALQEASSISFEFMGYTSDDGDLTQSYQVEWDILASFESPNRDCLNGVLCKNLLPTPSLPCIIPLYDGGTSCMYGTIYGLTSGTTYFFRISAFDGVSYSMPSSVAACTTQIKRTLLSTNKVVKAIFASFAVVGIILGSVNIFLLWIFRFHQVVVSASWFFCILVSIGIIAGYSLLFFFIVEPSSIVCWLSPWVAVLGYTLIFSPLFAKTRRIHLYLNNLSLNRVTITDAQLSREVAGFVSIDLLILGFLSKFEPLSLGYKDTRYGAYYTRSCSAGNSKFNGIVLLLVFYKLAMLLYGVYISLKVRKAPAHFNESKRIAVCIYNVVLAIIILIPLLFFVDQPGVKVVLKCIAVVWVCTSSLLSLFLPLWFGVFRPVRTYVENIENGLLNASLSDLESPNGNLPSPDISTNVESNCGMKVSPVPFTYNYGFGNPKLGRALQNKCKAGNTYATSHQRSQSI